MYNRVMNVLITLASLWLFVVLVGIASTMQPWVIEFNKGKLTPMEQQLVDREEQRRKRK